jgi:hypothetical protein
MWSNQCRFNLFSAHNCTILQIGHIITPIMKFALLNLCWFLGKAAAFRQRRGIRSVLATRRSSIGHPQEPNDRRSSRGDRNLMISPTTSPCSDDLLRSLSHPTTTNTSMRITNCTETEIQWDEDGIFTANMVRTVRAPCDQVLTTYKAYYNNGTDACQGFNACVVPNGTEGFIMYPGQYEYDCSTVYCGPNAARECDGTYRDNQQCPANVTNEASLPDIPLLRNVNCEVYSSFVIESDEKLADVCGPCQEDDQGLTTFTCEPFCGGCMGNNTVCITAHNSYAFSEHQLIYVSRATTTGGPVTCATVRSPAQFDSFADPSLFSCEMTVDGVACASCSVTDCGLGLNSLYTFTNVAAQIDCTNLDQVSKLNECDATGTGVFAPFFNDDFYNTCPNETAAVVPLIRAPPPIRNTHHHCGTAQSTDRNSSGLAADGRARYIAIRARHYDQGSSGRKYPDRCCQNPGPMATPAPAAAAGSPNTTTAPQQPQPAPVAVVVAPSVPPRVNNSSSSGTSLLVSSTGAVAICMAVLWWWWLLWLPCSGG